MTEPATTLNAETAAVQTKSASLPVAHGKSDQSIIETYMRYRGATFQQILDECGGAGRGFDVLRLALSVLILLSHCSWIVGMSGVTVSILNAIFHLNPDIASRLAKATTTVTDPNVHQLTGLARPITMSYLPMFFGLSGFLVTGSALRTRKLIPFSRAARAAAATGAVCRGDAVSHRPWVDIHPVAAIAVL